MITEARQSLPRLLWPATVLLVALAFWAGYSSRSAGSGAQTSAPSGPGSADGEPGQAIPTPSSEPVALPVPSFEPSAGTTSAADAATSPSVPDVMAAAPARGTTPPAPSSLEDIAQRATFAVVRVESGTTLGSGFFVGTDTILTNAHVAADSWSVQIRRADGRTAQARVAATSLDTDLAVLKVTNPDPGQVVLPMGSVNRVRSGQEVLAVGSPLGVFQNSVTRGIVSAVRLVGGVTLVQTDAAINPGNSGGPILTRDGEVVAIATMQIAARQGLNFGVGIDHARALIAGRQPIPAGGGTPVANLDSAMRDRDGSSADAAREEAAREYEEAVARAAKNADALDREWARFRSVCYQGRIPGAFDREWFALYEAQALRDPMSIGCEDYRTQLRNAAEEIRDFMAARDEAARRGGVYPGVQRAILAKVRLEYSGWTK